MEREVAPFISGWSAVRLPETPLVMRTDRSGDTAYLASGIGREPGIAASEALVAAFKPDVLVSAGFAGALVADHKVGDEVLVGVVVDGTTGESFRTETSSNSRIVSSGFIANRSAKLELHSRYDAEAVDMEGAAVGDCRETAWHSVLRGENYLRRTGLPDAAVRKFCGSAGAVPNCRISWARESPANTLAGIDTNGTQFQQGCSKASHSAGASDHGDSPATRSSGGLKDRTN